MSIDTKFVRGADKLKVRLATIRSKLFLPAFTEEIKDLLVGRTQRRFDREVDPNEKPWDKLAPSTIATKRRLGYGDKKILVRTGNLRGSIKAIRGGLGTIFTNTGAGFRIGIDDPEIVKYARVHNRGGGKIPMRKFLGIGALDIKSVDSLLRRKAKQLEEL